jgi:hypothetical protein
MKNKSYKIWNYIEPLQVQQRFTTQTYQIEVCSRLAVADVYAAVLVWWFQIYFEDGTSEQTARKQWLVPHSVNSCDNDMFSNENSMLVDFYNIQKTSLTTKVTLKMFFWVRKIN